MNRYDIMIGLTHSNRAEGYVSFCDGWRPGAKQDLHMVVLTSAQPLTDNAIAEAAFIATNDPDIATSRSILAQHVARCLSATGRAMRSVSVGDTVTVNGRRYECKRTGWARTEDVDATLDQIMAMEGIEPNSYAAGKVREVFDRHEIDARDIACLPSLIADLAALVAKGVSVDA